MASGANEHRDSETDMHEGCQSGVDVSEKGHRHNWLIYDWQTLETVLA